MVFVKTAVPPGMGGLTINNSIVKKQMTFEKKVSKGRADFTAGTAKPFM